MITPEEWTTSREDMDSFTTNPETGESEHVVYVYRGEQPRIAVFAGELNNARADAMAIASSVNSREKIGDLVEKLLNMEAASRLPMPDAIHVKCLRGLIEEVQSDLRTIFISITGEDPWRKDT